MFNTYSKEEDYMPPVAAAAQAKSKEFSLILLIAVGLLMIIFVVWAKATELDLMAKGQGKIVPIRKVQQISHYEGGILKEIKVKTGDKVEAGQVLAVIDNVKAKARHEKAKKMYFVLQAEVVRFEAQVKEKSKLKFSKELRRMSPTAVRDAKHNFKAWHKKLINEEQIAAKTVEQKTAELEGQEKMLEALHSQRKSHQEEIDRSKPHVGTVVSKSEFAQMTRAFSKIKSEVAATVSKIKTLKAAIEQAKRQKNQIHLNYKNEATKELANAQTRLAEAKQNYTTGKDEVSRTEVLAPTRGVVKEVLINTIGDTISSGETIMNLVPLDDALLFEVEIQPKDIGFIATGQKAIVKMGAYDFTIYGGLEGEVVEISPDSFTDKQGKTFFKVMVRTYKTYIMDKSLNKRMEITVGMMGEANVKIGKRSVFDSMIKPLTRGMQNAFREK